MTTENNLSRRGLALAGVIGVGATLAGCTVAPAATTPPSPSAPALIPGLLAAQGPLARPNDRIADAIATMKALEYMVGDWQGDGKLFTPQGEIPFVQTESVRYLSAGEMMAIEGRGTAPGNPEMVIFRALATLRLQGKTMMWWAASEGNAVDAKFTHTGKGFSWGISSPEYSVKYEALIEGDIWQHKGQQSTDGGKTWTPQLEFTVTRLK